MEIKRGNVYLVNLSGQGSEQAGVRPVVITSNDICNKFSPTITCLPLTSKTYKKPMPTHVFLSASQYPVEKDSIVLCEQIITIDKTRIIECKPLFSLNELEMIRLNRAMAIQLGMELPRQIMRSQVVTA